MCNSRKGNVAADELGMAKRCTCVDHSILGNIDGLGQDVAAEVANQQSVPDIRWALELNALNGLVVTVVHKLAVWRQIPFRDWRDALVVTLQHA